MNKLFISLFSLLLISLNSSAQKGNFIIGASSDVGDKSIILWSLTPTVGYFATDNLCVGLGFGMASASMEPDDYSLKQDTLSLNPFVRYYMDDSPLFIHGGMSIGSEKSLYEDPNNTQEVKTSRFGIVAGVGYSLRWGKYFVFEPMFALKSYSGKTKTKDTDLAAGGVVTESESDAPSILGIALSLGVSIQLGK